MLFFSLSVMSDSLRLHRLQHASPILHHLPELAPTHVHCVGYAIQPSHNGIEMFSYYQMFQTFVSFISPYTVFFFWCNTHQNNYLLCWNKMNYSFFQPCNYRNQWTCDQINKTIQWTWFSTLASLRMAYLILQTVYAVLP